VAGDALTSSWTVVFQDGLHSLQSLSCWVHRELFCGDTSWQHRSGNRQVAAKHKLVAVEVIRTDRKCYALMLHTVYITRKFMRTLYLIPSFFWGVTQRRLVVTNVSGHSVGPIFKEMPNYWRRGRLGRSETSVTTNSTLRNTPEERKISFIERRNTEIRDTCSLLAQISPQPWRPPFSLFA